ncbi:RNA helicase required for poly(A+) mRNA export [Imshaugia aleurites]|uniref:ATP-dependent RNA helicase n=1 Tax=Imshaugia aleurites TaxID=172621 RepID=A0A8H3FA35_9LECA|nr:RNA helicase required for poly(A+) mRNA export [Imshaugia aleurites]
MASLEDRISKPDNSQPEEKDTESSTGTNVNAAPFVPSGSTSWADETAEAATNSEPSAVNAKAEKEMSEMSQAQTDGASGPLGGSSGIYDPSYEVNVQLSDLQANPDDPLYSIKSFEELGLHENILKGIYQMRFTKPSKIQEKALPLLLRNPPTNMIGQSQSGTGKTAAFVLNLLSRLDYSPTMINTPQALVLAPSRELARQILGVIQIMGSFVQGLTAGLSIPTDVANRNREGLRVQIVVGTPGTTMDMIRRRQLVADHIKVLVLDEADNMLDQQGLGDQCIRVKLLLPKTIQVVLFSATFPDQVVEYASKFAPNANQITLRHEELTVEGIKQLYLDCPNEAAKYDALVRLYGLMTIGSSIIFVRTRETALRIERRMNEENHTVACLTGEYQGAQRDIIIDSFRSGQSKVLITTNVLSRGIDVQTVSLVVNYDLPDDGRGHTDPQTYLHRIGRTGRFGRVGVSVSLISGPRSYKMIKEISDYFGVEMESLPHGDWDQVEEIIKRVIKSSRAGSNFQTTNAVASSSANGTKDFSM